MKLERYNVRIYGILTNDRQEVLLTDERRSGYKMTKFPGGGLEFGEGLEDGLRREWREELDLEIQVGELFYINPFLQVSAFNPSEQLLSIYYRVKTEEWDRLNMLTRVPKLAPGPLDAQTFRWVQILSLDPSLLTFPIDRIVVEMLKG